MQRRSMLYEKVVNIQPNHPAALHWIAIDARAAWVWDEREAVPGVNLKKIWQSYKTTLTVTGSLITCTRKVIQGDTVISYGRLIDVITFMWQTKHLQATLYFCLMFPCQCRWDNKRHTHTHTHTHKYRHTDTQADSDAHTLMVGKNFRDEFLFLMFDFDLLYLMCTTERMSSTIFSLWPASCFDIK